MQKQCLTTPLRVDDACEALSISVMKMKKAEKLLKPARPLADHMRFEALTKHDGIDYLNYTKFFAAEGGVITPAGYLTDNNQLVYESTQLSAGYRDPVVVTEHIDVARESLAGHRTIDGAVFAGNFAWGNYQHFLVEHFPLLFVADKVLADDVAFVIKDVGHIVEIARLAFPHRRLIPLTNKESLLTTDTVVFAPLFQINFGDMHPFTAMALGALRKIVLDQIKDNPATHANTRVYYGRNNTSALNTGKTRRLLNEEALLSALAGMGFDHDFFEDKTLPEKALSLRGRKDIVTLAGANIMNLLFADGEISLHVIDHPHFKNPGQWICSLLARSGVSFGPLYCYAQTWLDQPDEKIDNAPYWADVPTIARLMKGYLETTNQTGA